MSYILTWIAFDIEPCLCILCFFIFMLLCFFLPTFSSSYFQLVLFLSVDFYVSYTPSTSPFLPFIVSLFFFAFKEVSWNLLKRKTTINHELSSRWNIYNSCLPPLPKEVNANYKQFYLCNLSIKCNVNYRKHFWVPRGMLCLKYS